MNQESDIRRRVEVVFLKKGISTASTGLAAANPGLAAEACFKLNIRNCDEIILVSSAADNRWAAITTSDLIWCDVSGVWSVKLKRIVEARVDFTKLRKEGGNLLSASKIDVIMDDESLVVVSVEPGGAMCGFWNALIAVAKDNNIRNRRSDPGS